MRFQKIFISLLVIYLTGTFTEKSFGQSIMQRTRKFLDEHANFSPDEIDSVLSIESGIAYKKYPPLNTLGVNCTLNKRIFAWSYKQTSTVYNNYQWNLITDLSYFSYSILSTGKPKNPTEMQNLTTNAMVAAAKSHNVNVNLAIAMADGVSVHTFLNNSVAQDTLVNRLSDYVLNAQLTGINVDLEGMQTSDSTKYKLFIQKLFNKVHVNNIEISIALQGSYANTNFYKFNFLNSYVNLYILMGYDYYWQSCTVAGPTDPLYLFQSNPNNSNLALTIDKILSAGASKDSFLLGLPCYGYDWATNSNQLNSTTIGIGAVIQQKSYKSNANYINQNWNQPSYTPYYIYSDTSIWHQAFIDNKYSSGKKMDMVNYRSLRGIALWEISQLGNDTDYWNNIQSKYTSCGSVPCTDTIYDMGGPLTNYNSNENYQFTIAPTGATNIQLSFTQFVTQSNKDSLSIYDGPNTSSPFLGKFSGSALPNTINSSGNSITVRFKTNQDTTKAGWTLIYNCITNGTGIGGDSLTAYEYWFDNNYVGKVAVPILPQSNYNLISSLPTNNLVTGLHTFNIRFKSGNNKWSSVSSDFFTKSNNKIKSYEYWFDNNYASKVSANVTQQSNFNLISSLPANSLNLGIHSFHIRFKDNYGLWSSVSTEFFAKIQSGTNKIKSYEYWFDNNYAGKVSQTVSPQVASYNLISSIPTSLISLGNHDFHIRFKDTNNAWSSVLSQSFSKTNLLSKEVEQNTETRDLKFSDSKHDLFIYPNPTSGEFIFIFNADVKYGFSKLEICNSLHQSVLQNSIEINEGINQEEINLTSLPSGIYYLNLITEKEIFSQKIIKE